MRRYRTSTGVKEENQWSNRIIGPILLMLWVSIGLICCIGFLTPETATEKFDKAKMQYEKDCKHEGRYFYHNSVCL